jgi:hypothetical protein
MQEFDCPHLPLRPLVKVRCHLYHPDINSNHSPNMRDMCHPDSPDGDWVVPNACTSSHQLKMLERTVMFPLFPLVLFHPFHVPAAKPPSHPVGVALGLAQRLERSSARRCRTPTCWTRQSASFCARVMRIQHSSRLLVGLLWDCEKKSAMIVAMFVVNTVLHSFLSRSC